MSGCYRCGGEDGNEAQLCPACTMRRKEERKQEKREAFHPKEVHQLRRESQGADFLAFIKDKLSLLWVRLFLIAALTAFAAFMLLQVFGSVEEGALLQIDTSRRLTA